VKLFIIQAYKIRLQLNFTVLKLFHKGKMHFQKVPLRNMPIKLNTNIIKITPSNTANMFNLN